MKINVILEKLLKRKIFLKKAFVLQVILANQNIQVMIL